MKVKVVAKTLLHDKLGRLEKGRVVDLPDNQASEFLRRGFVERYETKVVHSHPQLPAGEDESLSVSPVGQASPQTTSSESGSGKRKRPKKEA